MRGNTELAWLAGFLDADGWVSISRHTQRYSACAGFVTTSVKTKNRIAELLDKYGSKYLVHLRSPNNPRHTPRYDFEIRGLERVRVFLKLVLPYLVTKLEEAELALKFIDSRLGGRKWQPYSEAELTIARRVSELKRERGHKTRPLASGLGSWVEEAGELVAPQIQ